MAAPTVAHAAAQLFATFPDASANLIRALLVHGAETPPAASRLVLPSADDVLRLYGYGKPNLRRSLNSSDNRVILYAEDEIPLDWFHVYEIPIPDVFKSTPGERHVSVSLAFDPPVRMRNNRYLGGSMSFRLIRGVSLDQLQRVYQKPAKGERKDQFAHSTATCDMSPKSTIRDNGTLQHGTWTIKRSRALDHVEPFYLVLLNDNNWQNASDPPQRYAVVVSLEHTVPLTPLYNAIRTRTRVAQRTRVRR